MEHARPGSGPAPGAGDGALAAHLRAFDWSATPLGPIDGWSPTMRRRIDLAIAGRLLPDGGTTAQTRRGVEAALRDSRERQAFLLTLSDAIRPLADPVAIQAAASDLLGATLGADRVFYASIDGDTGDVRYAYARDVPSGVGEHSLSAFRPSRIPQWQAGEITRTTDSEADPAIDAADRAAYAAVKTRAAVGVPLVKGGELVALLAVNQATPRVWTDGEVALIAEVAERTWAAVERARAEAAMRSSEARFRQFGDCSSDVIWIRDAATMQVEYVSPAMRRIFGVDPKELAAAGDDLLAWAALIHPDDLAHALDALRRVRAGHRVTHEFRIRRPDEAGGRERWIRSTDFPLLDDHGRVQRIGGIGEDVTDLKRAEATIAGSEARLRTLAEGIPQLVWRSCNEGRWTWASPQWLTFTGQTQAESHGLGWLDAIHPDDRPATMRAWQAALPNGMLDVEYRVHRARDGAWVWHHTRSLPVRDADGRILEWLGTSTDVQEMRELQERQGVLVAELQHRTRNLIGVVRSMAEKSLRASETLDDFRDRFGDRMQALSRVQGLLSQLSSGRRVTFGELIRAELAAVGAGDDPRVSVNGPAGVRLRSGDVQTLAMAVHELATNAIKYGALAQADAQLSIAWTVLPPDGEPCRRLRVDWQETGVAMPPGEAEIGHGRELIEHALPYQLDARTSFDLTADGVRCSIELPISSALAAGAVAEH